MYIPTDFKDESLQMIPYQHTSWVTCVVCAVTHIYKIIDSKSKVCDWVWNYA